MTYELDDLDRELLPKMHAAIELLKEGEPISKAMDSDDINDALCLLFSILDAQADDYQDAKRYAELTKAMREVDGLSVFHSHEWDKLAPFSPEALALILDKRIKGQA